MHANPINIEGEVVGKKRAHVVSVQDGVSPKIPKTLLAELENVGIRSQHCVEVALITVDTPNRIWPVSVVRKRSVRRLDY